MKAIKKIGNAALNVVTFPIRVAIAVALLGSKFKDR